MQKVSCLPLGSLSFDLQWFFSFPLFLFFKPFRHSHAALLSYLFYFTAALWQTVYNYKIIAAGHVRLAFIRRKYMPW